jgi:hypothetical protein
MPLITLYQVLRLFIIHIRSSIVHIVCLVIELNHMLCVFQNFVSNSKYYDSDILLV